MGCGPSTAASMNTPDPPSASTTPPWMDQLAADFLNQRVAELGTKLSLKVAERNRLQNQRNDLAAQHPTYVPNPNQVPMDIWNEVEDNEYKKQLDELMAKYDAEVGPHVQGGKDRKEVLRVLSEKRAEIRDVRKEIGLLQPEVALYKLQGGV